MFVYVVFVYKIEIQLMLVLTYYQALIASTMWLKLDYNAAMDIAHRRKMPVFDISFDFISFYRVVSMWDFTTRECRGVMRGVAIEFRGNLPADTVYSGCVVEVYDRVDGCDDGLIVYYRFLSPATRPVLNTVCMGGCGDGCTGGCGDGCINKRVYRRVYRRRSYLLQKHIYCRNICG